LNLKCSNYFGIFLVTFDNGKQLFSTISFGSIHTTPEPNFKVLSEHATTPDFTEEYTPDFNFYSRASDFETSILYSYGCSLGVLPLGVLVGRNMFISYFYIFKSDGANDVCASFVQQELHMLFPPMF